jgi:hypothetical protein
LIGRVVAILVDIFDPQLLLLARNVHDRLNVRYPDKLLTLEIFENTARCLSTIGRSNHKGMDADRYDRGITVRKSLGLPGQFGYIVDPEPLSLLKIPSEL